MIVSRLVEGLRPSPAPVDFGVERCFPVGRIFDGGRSWRVFVSSMTGALLAFDDDGLTGWADVVCVDRICWDDAYALGFARSCGGGIPIGGAL